METKRIRVGITHGDINGIGYEVILKTFSDPMMLELCTPVIYGSPKVAAYHRKTMDIPVNFSIVGSASEVKDGRVNVVNCMNEELKVELSKPTSEAGKAALLALDKALEEYREGLFDVLVTAPVNAQTVWPEEGGFSGHSEYLQERTGEGKKALTVLVNHDFRIALATGDIPVREISHVLTKELLTEKIAAFSRSLKIDFGVGNPRIAVFGLNPHAGENGPEGTEETEIIVPAMKEMINKGVQCFGPYSAEDFIGAGDFTHFDGILAMYHAQGMIPFRTLAMEEGVNFTAGLPIVHVSPVHGTAYDIAGRGIASESSFRQAVYLAIDVFRSRCMEREISAHPLRKQYYEKKDDSDKLKLDTPED